MRMLHPIMAAKRYKKERLHETCDHLTTDQHSAAEPCSQALREAAIAQPLSLLKNIL
jgi:hypothetical protein